MSAASTSSPLRPAVPPYLFSHPPTLRVRERLREMREKNDPMSGSPGEAGRGRPLQSAPLARQLQRRIRLQGGADREIVLTAVAPGSCHRTRTVRDLCVASPTGGVCRRSAGLLAFCPRIFRRARLPNPSITPRLRRRQHPGPRPLREGRSRATHAHYVLCRARTVPPCSFT